MWVRVAGFSILFAAVSSGLGLAQSGRVRGAKPAPPASGRPVTKPGTAVAPQAAAGPVTVAKPIPAGGSVVSQTVDASVTRSELENGTIFVARDNPAAAVASLVTAIPLPGGIDAERAVDAIRSASRSGADSPAASLAAVGGMLALSAEDGYIFISSSVVARDADAVVVAHAALLASQDGREGSLPLTARDATVAASGQIDSFSLLATVQREFGAIEPPAPVAASPETGRRAQSRVPPVAPPPPPAAVPAAGTTRYTVESGAAGPARVSIEFDPASARELDGAVVEVLAAALGMGSTSRLPLLFADSTFVSDASAHAGWRAGGRTIAVDVWTDVARIDDASAMTWRELDRFRRERMSDAELQRARNQAELDRTLMRSRSDDDAVDLVQLELGTHAAAAASARLVSYRTVTAAGVQAAAARLFSFSGATVVESVPPGSPARPASAEAFAARAAVWAPGMSKPVAPGEIRDRPAAPATEEGVERGRSGDRGDSVLVPLPLPVRDFSTLNGPKAFVREDASQPVVAIGFFFPGGRAAELDGNRGITELMLRSMTRGSKGYPGDALLFAIERLGGRVRIVNDADFFGVVVETLSRNADLVVPVAIDLVERPQFETVSVLRERDRLLVDQKQSRIPPARAASNLFWQSRYPTHTYGVAPEGLPESIAKQNDESVRAWYATSVKSLYPLVGIVGDTDGSSLVSRYVVEGFDRPDGDRLKSPAVPAPGTAAEVAIQVPSARTVAAIAVVTPGGSWDALEAIEIALRSVQLRASAFHDEAGVIEVSCGLERRRQAGAAVCTVVSSPESEVTARSAVVSELARVAAPAWPAGEIAAGRRAAVAAWTLANARCGDMCVSYVRVTAFGLPLGTVERYGERIDALPDDGIRRAAAAVLDQGRVGRGVVRGVPVR